MTGVWNRRSGARPAAALGVGCLVGGLLAGQASAVPLQFDQLVGEAPGSSILGATTEDLAIEFLNVGQDGGFAVDARVTASVLPETDFGSVNVSGRQSRAGDPGFIPDYAGGSSGPQKDLGFLYYGSGVNPLENGVSILFEFFDGSGAKSGTFAERLTLGTIDLAIYDVDGEPSQSEFFTAYKSDGLKSYQLGTSPQALSATDQGTQVRFDGPGTNFPESDATGAAILHYELTETLRLDFGSVQSASPFHNGVFSGIDGDLSFIDPDGFGDPVPVSSVALSPSALYMACALCIVILVSRGTALLAPSAQAIA